MNEAIIQAGIRAVRVFLVAGLVALGADASNIVEIGTQGDVITGPLVLSVVTAVIDAVLKFLGGPTAKAPVTHGRGAPAGSIDRPNFLSV